MMPSERTATAQALVRDIEVRSWDGMALRGRWWRRQSPRGAVIISHGFAEHGGCYRRTAEVLGARLDLDVIAVDYRGHGRSPAGGALCERYDDLVGDLASAWRGPRGSCPSSPGLCSATPMAGKSPSAWSSRVRARSRGWLSPTRPCASRLPIPPAKLKLGRFLAKVAPWVTLSGDLRTGVSDSRPRNSRGAPHRPAPAQSDQPPLFFGMVEGGEMLLARAGEIRLPILMLLGGQDSVIDPSTSREFFERLGSEDKTLLFYPKMLHEPFNELGREQVYEDVGRWLEPRLPAR